MLDDYKETNFVVYKQLKNSISKNLSHAYLFIKNKNIESDNIIKAFVKSIVCENSYLNNINCNNCNICKRIDNNAFFEVKEIKAEGLWIKKEQLTDLQKKFSTKPIEGKKRVYIIQDAEKLNKQAANSILKFLEEPTNDIIAILVTENPNLVLETIKSRCQNIIFKKNNIKKITNVLKYKDKTLLKLFFACNQKEKLDEYMNNEHNKTFLINTVNFIENMEFQKIKTINNTKNLFLNIFEEKPEILLFFEYMILYYKDVLYYKNKKELIFFEDYINNIEKSAENNSISKILYKINKFIEYKEFVKQNININLLIDRLIIEIEGGI